MKIVAIAVPVVAIIAAGYLVVSSYYGVQNETDTHGLAIAKVNLPEKLSAKAQLGRDGFEANCAACHGTNAAGLDGVAPPLVHIIYEPNHHGDESFQRAAALGVRGHHWPFGDMPPVKGLVRSDVEEIVSYVRELQMANGIN